MRDDELKNVDVKNVKRQNIERQNVESSRNQPKTESRAFRLWLLSWKIEVTEYFGDSDIKSGTNLSKTF